MENAFIEIHQRDGKKYKIWLDGRIEGFPQDSVILNALLPFVRREREIYWLKGKEYSSILARLRRVLTCAGLASRKAASQGNATLAPPQPVVKSRG